MNSSTFVNPHLTVDYSYNLKLKEILEKKVDLMQAEFDLALLSGLRSICPEVYKGDGNEIRGITTANNTIVYFLNDVPILEIQRNQPFKWRKVKPDHMSNFIYINDECGYHNPDNDWYSEMTTERIYV